VRAARLDLAGFEWTVAGLQELMMGAILCRLVVAAVLRLDILEWVVAVRCCKLVVVVTLKMNSRSWAQLKWEALGWQVHNEDLWVDRAMVAGQQDPKLAMAQVWEQQTELAH